MAAWQGCPGLLPPYANLNQSLFYVLIDHQRAAYLSHKYGPTLAAFLQHYSTILTAFCPCSHLIMVSFCCRFSCCIPTKFGQHFPPIFGYSFDQSLPWSGKDPKLDPILLISTISVSYYLQHEIPTKCWNFQKFGERFASNFAFS